MADRKSDGEGIGAFWAWFSARVTIRHEPADQALVAELDERVNTLHPGLSWEIGPGAAAARQLVISPNLDLTLAPIAAAIVAAAPAVDDWEFHAWRQPKRDWNFTFALAAPDGRSVDVDASNWRFVLLHYPEGEREIVLQADDLEGLVDAQRELAAVIVLESVLGEEHFVSRVDTFALLDLLEPRLAERAQSIRELGNVKGL